VCVNQGHSVVVEQMKRSLVESGSAEESQSRDTAGMSACTMCTEWLIVHCQTSLLLIFFKFLYPLCKFGMADARHF